MTIWHALLGFTLAAALLTITPGLDTALVLRTAAVEGPRRAILAGLGIACGCLTWGFAASVGLGALLAASHVAYNFLRIAGACYLVFLGVKIFLRRHLSVPAEDEPLPSALYASANVPNWFLRGLFTDLLNPKMGVFYVTLLPQFIPTGVSVTFFSMILAAIHATEGVIWFSMLSLAIHPLSRWMRRPRTAKALDRVTGTVLIGFGLGLVFDRRH